MDWDIDSLVDFLIDQVSLKEGACKANAPKSLTVSRTATYEDELLDASIEDVSRWTHEYACEKARDAVDPSTFQESIENPETLANVSRRLASHPDITVKYADESGKSTSSKKSRLVITASEAQRWHAIVGHPVNTPKFTLVSFPILAILAAAGRQGVTRNRLQEQSGLNNLALGHRLGSLLRKEYITSRQTTGPEPGPPCFTLQRYKPGLTELQVAVAPLRPSCSVHSGRQASASLDRERPEKVFSPAVGFQNKSENDVPNKTPAPGQQNTLQFPNRNVHQDFDFPHDASGATSDPTGVPGIAHSQVSTGPMTGPAVIEGVEMSSLPTKSSQSTILEDLCPQIVLGPADRHNEQNIVLPQAPSPHLPKQMDQKDPVNLPRMPRNRTQKVRHGASTLKRVRPNLPAQKEHLPSGNNSIHFESHSKTNEAFRHQMRNIAERLSANELTSVSVGSNDLKPRESQPVNVEFQEPLDIAVGLDGQDGTIGTQGIDESGEPLDWVGGEAHHTVRTEVHHSSTDLTISPVAAMFQDREHPPSDELDSFRARKRLKLLKDNGEDIADGALTSMGRSPEASHLTRFPSPQKRPASSAFSKERPVGELVNHGTGSTLLPVAKRLSSFVGAQIPSEGNSSSTPERPGSKKPGIDEPVLDQPVPERPLPGEQRMEQNTQESRRAESVQNLRFRTIFEQLLNLSLPGVYINPPSKLPDAPRGRPRKRMLIVCKSGRLKDYVWFTECTELEKIKYQIQPPPAPPKCVRSWKDSLVVAIRMSRLHSLDWFAHSIDQQVSKEVPRQVHRLVESGSFTWAPNAFNDAATESRIRDERLVSSPPTEIGEILPTIESDVGQILGEPSRSYNAFRSFVQPITTLGQPTMKRHDPDQPQVTFVESRRSRSKDGVRDTMDLGPSDNVGAADLPKKAKKSKQPAWLAGEARREILLRIIDKAGGAFPGNSEIWFPFVTVSHKSVKSTPYRSNVDDAVASLVRSGRLKKAIFAFRDLRGTLVEKSIVCLPSVDFHSEVVKTCEKGITKAHPFMYFPDGVEIDPEIDPQKKSQGFRTHGKSSARTTYHGNAHEKLTKKKIQDVDDVQYRKKRDLQFANSAPSTDSVQWNWVYDDLNIAAAEHEVLREQAAREQKDNAGLILSNHTGESPVNASGWITSMTRKGNATHECFKGFATCVTLTDPSQLWHEKSGTLSTDFASYRSSRPELAIDTNVQRLFEDSLPANLEEMIPECISKDWPQEIAFERTVDAVEAWEQANETSLVSHKSLVTSRFINLKHPSESTLVHSPAMVRKDLSPDKTREPPQKEKGPSGIRKSSRATKPSKALSRAKETQTLWRKLQGKDDGTSLDEDLHGRRHVPTSPNAVIADSSAARPQNNDVLEDDTPLSPRIRHASLEAPNGGPSRSFDDLGDEASSQRLVIAVVMTRTLLGGIKRKKFFSLVASEFFPDFSPNMLRYKHSSLLRRSKAAIDWYEAAFNKAFLEAYAAGELPTLDYNNIANYDWQALMDWALQQWPPPEILPISLTGRFSLPASRSNFTQKYATVQSVRVNPEVSTDILFDSNVGRSRPKRTQAIHSLNAANQLDTFRCDERDDAPPNERLQDVDVAITYVRANVFTPTAKFKADEALSKLANFDSVVLQKALDELVSQRIISRPTPTGKEDAAVPSRSHVPERFYSFFKTCWTPEMLRGAASYKVELDTELHGVGEDEANGSSIVLAPACPTPAQTMVITSLLSQRHISLRPHLGKVTSEVSTKPIFDRETGERRLSMWGFTGEYQPVKDSEIDPSHLAIPMRITPTEMYTPGLSAHLKVPLPDPPAPHMRVDSVERRIPLWWSIHDELMTNLWEMLLAAVLMKIVLRPSMDEARIVKALGEKVGAWDVGLLVGWLVAAGAVQRETRGGGTVKLNVKDGWWGVLGTGIGEGYNGAAYHLH